MALKDKHLADGEEIRLDLRTHWKALIGPLVLLVLLVAFVAAAAVLTRDSDQRTWIVLGVAVVALALAVPGVLVPVWRWNSTRYVFTNRRVSNRYGLLTKRGRDIPLYRINDVAIEKSVLDRMLGCGTLVISDATDKAGMELHDVPRSRRCRSSCRTSSSPPTTAATTANGHPRSRVADGDRGQRPAGPTYPVIPNRAWRRFIHRGAHQFHSPRTDMVAGTSSMRTRVASMTIASTRATPVSLTARTRARTNPPKTMHMSSAALVMILPERCRPSRTASLVEWPRSCSSTMRESRKTS